MKSKVMPKVSGIGCWLPREPSRAAFLLARAVTVTIFLAILIALVWRVRKSSDPADWLRVGFLILAWFWLLSPTQNPWYWTWALPLVMFAHSRAWLAVSGLVMVYYLRFWLTYHWPEQPVAGTAYCGAAFFDFVVTWFEYGPWLLCLVGEAVWRRAARSQPAPTIDSSSQQLLKEDSTP